ncbi:MAG: hypothetical protein AAF441_02465, partial [Pseudomonadota bacterium]
ASWKSLGLNGDETVSLAGLEGDMEPGMTIAAAITMADGKTHNLDLLCRIDTLDELEYYRNGGILHYVLRNLAQAA